MVIFLIDFLLRIESNQIFDLAFKLTQSCSASDYCIDARQDQTLRNCLWSPDRQRVARSVNFLSVAQSNFF